MLTPLSCFASLSFLYVWVYVFIKFGKRKLHFSLKNVFFCASVSLLPNYTYGSHLILSYNPLRLCSFFLKLFFLSVFTKVHFYFLALSFLVFSSAESSCYEDPFSKFFILDIEFYSCRIFLFILYLTVFFFDMSYFSLIALIFSCNSLTIFLIAVIKFLSASFIISVISRSVSID